MKNILLDTAENLYKAIGRDSAIAFMYANWKLTSSDKALEEIVDFINYVADMEEGKR
jgi:hypothetical protein